MSAIISSKDVKIRKPRSCWGCNNVYPAGTSMRAVACADDGTVETIYWCEVCCKYISRYCRYDDEFARGEFIDNDPEGWGELKNELFKENGDVK